MFVRLNGDKTRAGNYAGKMSLGLLLCLLLFQGIVFSETSSRKESTNYSVTGFMKEAVRSGAINIGKKFVEYKIFYQTRDYEEINTGHFTIRYRQEDREWAEIIGTSQEDSYQRLVREFGFELDKKMLVVVYPNSQDFIRIHFPGAQKSPMGLYYAGTIGILSPSQWVDGSTAFTDAVEKFQKEGPVVHELVHAFVDIKTDSKYPLWFTEGVALYYENKITGFEWGKGMSQKLAGLSLSGGLISEQSPAQLAKTIYRLNSEFDTMDQDLAYRRSYEVIKDIANKHGEAKLSEIMNELSKGRDILEILSSEGLI